MARGQARDLAGTHRRRGPADTREFRVHDTGRVVHLLARDGVGAAGQAEHAQVPRLPCAASGVEDEASPAGVAELAVVQGDARDGGGVEGGLPVDPWLAPVLHTS